MGLASMPTGAKIGAGVVGLAGVSMLMYRILPPQMLYYITIGVLALGVVLGGLAWVAAQLKQRKAKPMEKSLRDNSAATPQGVADPGRRARMDDLRKTFDTGVEKFKAAGKNLYSLPWYVLVGEPG
jgi:type VI protein secretion system component VasK